jgi:cytochrome b subunit of formate dehydrogenase
LPPPREQARRWPIASPAGRRLFLSNYRILRASALVMVLAFAAWAAQRGTGTVTPNSVCADCHDSAAKLKKSAHVGVECASCHLKHEEYPHPEKSPKPACSDCHASIVQEYNQSTHALEIKKGNAGAPDCAFCHGEKHEIAIAKSPEARRASMDNCGGCHDKALAQFTNSAHGKAVAAGIREAPVCIDCHSAHSIRGPKRDGSPVGAMGVPDTCGHCHGDLKLMQRFGLNANQVTTFASSFHGLALRSGEPSVAECASCHGYHDILPSSDPKSRIHPNNIAKTCSSCHPGAGSKFPIGKIHAVEFQDEPKPVQWARIFYLMLIPGTIGMMFVHHLGDFIRKFHMHRFQGQTQPAMMMKPSKPHLRMHRFERIQHFLLMVSFIVLAYSGFALHYPDEWWSRWLLAWEKTYPIRGTVHRTAGIILMITSVIHIISLIVDKTLRQHWTEMLPRLGDMREMVEGTLWRLGLRRERPHQSPHSYVEKAEYWALVWGTAVMALTGIALWANNWMLANLPKFWYDLSRVVHYYEAVLATLAIVVWHFYTVIFDPEVYPMDPSWYSGYSPREFPEHGHAPAHGQDPKAGG